MDPSQKKQETLVVLHESDRSITHLRERIWIHEVVLQGPRRKLFQAELLAFGMVRQRAVIDAPSKSELARLVHMAIPPFIGAVRLRRKEEDEENEEEDEE